MTDLASQIRAVSTARDTRDAIVEYYQEKYSGENWRKKLGQDMGPVLGIQPKSIERRFQDRGGVSWDSKEPGKKAKAEYALFGNTVVPPIPPDSGYHVEGTVWILFSESCEDRDIDEYLDGQDAIDFANSFSEQIIINQYMGGDGYTSCGEPSLTISVG